MAELKPCPFCGSGSVHIMVTFLLGEMESYYLVCTGCGARSAAHVYEELAIEAWNRRAEDGK